MAEPKDPITPKDYNPEGKDYPHEPEDIIGEPDKGAVQDENYETETTDEEGRPVGMRRSGHFITPIDEDMAGEGWTLPTRAGGGWDHPVEPSLEEQIDEPETPQDINNK